MLLTRSITQEFYENFIQDNRWKYLTDGLLITLEVTFFALIFGIILGFFIAIVRSTYLMTGKMKVLNFIFNIYVTIIRGTPVALQIMIIYYCIFETVDINKVFVAVIAFGLNSGAYVSEIVRSGIMSIDKGQFEAGRSLGFTHRETMSIVILPQAFKNVLPALGNEFIVLLKETSVASFIAIQDLTKGSMIIQSRTFSPYMPLFMAAAIYLILVMIFSKGISVLEGRLRNSDH